MLVQNFATVKARHIERHPILDRFRGRQQFVRTPHGRQELHHYPTSGTSGEARKRKIAELHGYPGSSREYMLSSEPLAEFGNVYDINLPGHGMSEAPRWYIACEIMYVSVQWFYLAG